MFTFFTIKNWKGNALSRVPKFLKFQAVTTLTALPPQKIVSGCRSGTIKIWDVGSSNRMHMLENVCFCFSLFC